MVDVKMFKKIIALLDDNNFNYWVYGGFALDGLRGEISREHQDIDIYLDSADLERLIDLLKLQQFTILKRDSMYFAELGDIKLGVLLLDFVDGKIIANGNLTLAKYPKEIFDNECVVSIEGFSFRIVPNEIIFLESKFSKHESDRNFSSSLTYDKDLFNKIETTKVRESRSANKN